MSRTLQVQVLEGTIALFEKEGSWTQKKMASTFFDIPAPTNSWWARRRCADAGLLYITIQVVGKHNPSTQRVYRSLMERVQKHVSDHYGRGLHYWNDSEGRTREEVVALFREVLASVLGGKRARPAPQARRRADLSSLVPA